MIVTAVSGRYPATRSGREVSAPAGQCDRMSGCALQQRRDRFQRLLSTSGFHLRAGEIETDLDIIRRSIETGDVLFGCSRKVSATLQNGAQVDPRRKVFRIEADRLAQ